uniref:probable receptor-like protein kinase At5g59700 n=1 Tax=Erigeron canadensis TaxID=72917 RepID=UPI001CB8F976|nr:probable receptor-like protein kinase At5g59700 [Erigeron canadensis]
MSSSEIDFKKFQIPLEEIKKATNNFHSDIIGEGGFGVVYKGQLSEGWQNITAAIKRHNQNGHQGKKEFDNELDLISRFHHENIIPFIGYCDEGNEMIFVFKYAVNRSLEYHLEERSRSRCITWEQRIKICLGAARGLNYLHSGLGEHFRVIHRDVKSGNILLDENMEAQVCDFGLSKPGSKGQQHSEIHTNVAGTDIYMDPNYRERSTLTKESDVYSLGVVMFEMLSGMLAYWRKNIGEAKARSLLNLVRRYYENNEVEKLIDPHIRDQIPEIQYLDPQIEDNVEISPFYTFINIAYKCISLDLNERPSMKEIISRFETALHNHEKNPPLIKCVMGDMRSISDGKPVVAFTIYNHLVHLNSFVDEIGNVFDRLVQILNVAVKKKHTTESMVYLLANLLVLDFLTKLGTEFECQERR